jgi:hypothetical protein
MAIFCGWDLGGVHLKLSVLETGAGTAPLIHTFIVPFEIWKDAPGLARRLRALSDEALRPGAPRDGDPQAHGVTLTAEFSDVFPSRAAGVRAVLSAFSEAVGRPPARVLDVDGRFIDRAEAMERPLRVAAANFMAGARLAARLLPAGLLVDVGSTTTDIVPVKEGAVAAAGRTDLDRLQTGELVYGGLQRTPPAALAAAAPLRGGWCRLVAESFAITADVYRVLERIGEEDYTAPTPDGRGRSWRDSAARLARLLGSDLETLLPEEIRAVASFLMDRQIDAIARAIRQVVSRDPSGLRGARAVVAGAGAFLAEAAARRADLVPVALPALLPEVRGGRWDVAAPSAAIALLLAADAGALALGPSGA